MWYEVHISIDGEVPVNLASDLVLDDADGTDVTYRKTASLSNGSEWIDVATNLTEPGRMKILHSSNGKGSDVVDRHLVSFSRTLVDATGSPRTVTLNFTMSVPRSTVITGQIVYDAVGNLVDLLSNQALTTALSDTTAIAQILRGES